MERAGAAAVFGPGHGSTAQVYERARRIAERRRQQPRQSTE